MEGIKQWIEAEATGHCFFVAFPVCLALLFIWFKGRRAKFLIPSLLISLAIINPVFYKIWGEMGLYAYWRILWIVPVIPVLAAVVPSVTERMKKSWLKGTMAVAGTGLIVFAGTFLYNSAGGKFFATENAEKLPDDVIQIADLLLELDEGPRIIAQQPVGIYIRQYTGEINQLYGRDIDHYILTTTVEARAVYNQVSNGELNAVAQYMRDTDYDYLIYRGATGDNFELVDTVADYGIYKLR